MWVNKGSTYGHVDGTEVDGGVRMGHNGVNRVPTKVLLKNSLTFQTGFQKFQLVPWYESYHGTNWNFWKPVWNVMSSI